jgi:hypothetical protein
MQNKANFQKAKNEYNFSNSNDYEQKTTNYELFKTNPNKANLVAQKFHQPKPFTAYPK